MRAQQQQEDMNGQLRQIVDGPGGNPPLAAPGGGYDDHNDHKNDNKSAGQAAKDKFKNSHILYNSLQRGACYYAFAWLWCGCFEPKYKITSTYVIGEEWHSCVRVTDSMAFESVDDVQRFQPCCLCLAGMCPCFRDMADIILLGQDESHEHGWKLKRLHNSTQLFDQMTKILQDNSKKPKK